MPVYELPNFANVLITGGSIDGTPIGATTPNTGKFTGLTTTGGTPSTSTTTGDLVVAGGVGIGGTVFTQGLTAGTIKAYSSSAVGTRQTVLTGSVNTNGFPNALSAGTGLAITLTASPTFLVSFANGWDNYGQSDFVAPITANQSFRGSLTQRYVKRHAPARKGAKINCLHGFPFPFLRWRFQAVFWGWDADRIPELFIGEVVLAEQIDMLP